MNMDLTGKHAVVCGSTQGIGKASALALSNRGASITLMARNEEQLKKVLTELQPHQQNDYIVADFSHPVEVEDKIKQWSENHVAHILLNNTGGPKGGPIIEAKPSEFTAAFSQHLVCNHVLVQALFPGMKEEGYGRIINVISTSVKQPIDNLGVSNTIRGAVANWSKTLANEIGKYNITVNNILPGFTNTSRLQSIAKNKVAKGLASDTEEAINNMANMSPMKRVAQPEELANAVVFLASPAASYINGINVPIDGGRTKSL